MPKRNYLLGTTTDFILFTTSGGSGKFFTIQGLSE